MFTNLLSLAFILFIPGAYGCYPIWIRKSDHFYAPRGLSCLNEVTRTEQYCEENDQSDWLVPRQQFNQNTHFIDASNVYGNNDARAELLRAAATDGTNNEEMMGKLTETNNKLLPTYDSDSSTCSLGCEMASGDVRATEMPGLASMHTLFFREHNRVAGLIKDEMKLNRYVKFLVQNSITRWCMAISQLIL